MLNARERCCLFGLAERLSEMFQGRRENCYKSLGSDEVVVVNYDGCLSARKVILDSARSYPGIFKVNLGSDGSCYLEMTFGCKKYRDDFIEDYEKRGTWE